MGSKKAYSYGLVRAEIGQRSRRTSKFEGKKTHKNGESLISVYQSEM